MSSDADLVEALLAENPALRDTPIIRALLAELALSRNLYDELFSQTELLRMEVERQLLREPYLELTEAQAENQRLRDALKWYDDHKNSRGAYDGALWGDLSDRAALDGT